MTTDYHWQKLNLRGLDADTIQKSNKRYQKAEEKEFKLQYY